MAVEIIQSLGSKDLNPQKNVDGEKTPSAQNKRQSKIPQGQSADDVQISSQARALKEEFETLKTQAQKTSTESQQRIEAAKLKLQSGYYLRDDILEEVAGKILESDEIRSVIHSKHENPPLITASRAVPDSLSDKISLAKNRAAQGFYQQNSVLKITAEKIIEDLFA